MTTVAGPTGTVTFLFTDIEGSSRLWDNDRTAMQDALARHDEILQQVFAGHRGFVCAAGGDGFTYRRGSGTRRKLFRLSLGSYWSSARCRPRRVDRRVGRHRVGGASALIRAGVRRCAVLFARSESQAKTWPSVARRVREWLRSVRPNSTESKRSVVCSKASLAGPMPLTSRHRSLISTRRTTPFLARSSWASPRTLSSSPA
jgi:class 3 adenylate cyclase